MAKSEKKLKSLLMKMKEESEKASLKFNIQKIKIMASSPITSRQIDGKTMEIVRDFIFMDPKITVDGDCSHEIQRHLLIGRKAMTNLDTIFKKQRHCFAYKGLYCQSYDFSSSHVWMWELDNKKGWVPKIQCLQTVLLEKTFESPLDSKIKPVNTKGNQPWIFIGSADAEAEASLLWPPDGKNWFIGKDSDAGTDWR